MATYEQYGRLAQLATTDTMANALSFERLNKLKEENRDNPRILNYLFRIERAKLNGIGVKKAEIKVRL